jgi:hypothetical protein
MENNPMFMDMKEKMLSKYPYFPKQCICSMQSLCKIYDIFYRNRDRYKNLYGTPKNKNKVGGILYFLILKCIMKPQSSKENGNGIKIGM